jgi:hypothetical protein
MKGLCPSGLSHSIKRFAICLTAGLLWTSGSLAQEAGPSTSKPAEQVTGTITSVDQAAHTVALKEDKTGTEYTIELQNTKTLLKVEPTAKDLKNATRITAEDLAAGDRIQIRGSKTENNSNAIAARSVLLMSARELQQVHQQQAAAWQHSTPGVVTSIDSAGQKLTISMRTPEGPKQMLVDASHTEFTRHSPENPKTPVASRLADIQPGDQVRIIGETSSGAEAITAHNIYSSSFRTIVGTVSSIAADGKQVTIKDLQTKQPVTVTLNDDSAIRKLPPMLAFGLARRFNPDFKPPQDTGPGGGRDSGPANAAPGAPPNGASGAGQNRPGGGPGAGGGGMRAAASGDLSQILDRLPKISAADLKTGDAVVVSGSPAGTDKTHLLATNVIAGVEPIFQSASPRQAQSLGDWGASLGGGGAETGGTPGGPPQQ